MAADSPNKVQLGIALVIGMCAGAGAFLGHQLLSWARLSSVEFAFLCGLAGMLLAMGAVSLWRLSFPDPRSGDWYDEDDEGAYDFGEVRFTRPVDKRRARDHLRVVKRPHDD